MAEFIKIVLKFITEKFSQMPAAVQIATYIVFVFVTIYTATLPSFIDMKLVSVYNKEVVPLRDVEIQVEVAGRSIRILTDSYGRFCVPMSTMLPTDSIVFSIKPDQNKDIIKEIKVPVLMSYFDRARLVFNKKDLTYTVSNVDDLFSKMLSWFQFIENSYAQNQRKSNDNIKAEILKLLADAANKNPDAIDQSEKMRISLSLDNVGLSFVSNKITAAYGIDSWTNLNNPDITVAQLIESIILAIDEKSIPRNSNNQPFKRVRTIEVNEVNTHCQSARRIRIPVRTESGWLIDASTISSSINVSSGSSYLGVTNISSSGFDIEGKVSNSGSCIKIFGKAVARDGRGHLWGKVTYIENKVVP